MAKYKIIPSSRTIVQSPISIGHKAEKGVEAIEFDLTAWVETYGSGTLTVIMRRWGDAIPYPITLEIDENNKATWTLSDTDTARAGMAYAQLNYIVGDEVVKKSDIYTFRVMDSLTGEGDPPEAYESWLEHLTHLAAEAMAEVLDIEGIVTDKTLTVDGGIADAKAAGDALALKADKSTTYTKTEVDQMIENVEVETDTTLEIAGAPADAKKVGDELSDIKADLDDVNESLDDALGRKVELTKFDANYNRRVNPSETSERSDGSRIRIVYKIDYPTITTMQCTAEKGLYVALYETYGDALLANTRTIETYTDGYSTSEITCTINQSGYLSISQCKTDGSSITDAEREALFDALTLEMTVYTSTPYRLEKIEADIENLKDDANAEDTAALNSDMNGALVSVSGYNTLASGSWTNPTPKKKNLCFAVISDVHGSSDALNRFFEYANKKSKYFDFCLGLGDFVVRQPSEDTSWINTAVAKSEIPFFYTVGNHDAADTGLSGITQATARTKYFSTIETKGWLESTDFMGSGKCSWVKDISAYNIRIISLFEYGNADAISSGAPASYCRRWMGSDLLQWFADKLYATPSGYSVIVLLHMVPSAPMDLIDDPFSYDNTINWSSLFLNTIDGNPIEEIVNAFKNSTSIAKTYNSISSYGLGKSATVSKDFSGRSENGNFIAYFAGHTHASYVLKSSSFAEQMCVIVPTGSENIFQRNYGDLLYDAETRNKDNFYCVGIDTNSKKINLIKIGAQVTTEMKERILTSISY